MKPLDRLVASAREEFELEMATYEVATAIAEAQHTTLKDAIKRTVKEAETSGDRSGIEKARTFRAKETA